VNINAQHSADSGYSEFEIARLRKSHTTALTEGNAYLAQAREISGKAYLRLDDAARIAEQLDLVERMRKRR
jgi:hypothetical protein